ncbi:Cloroperoxidase [Abortiporus biennis]|nr:Cloroperoxidase [Abortiporus biennis]
MPSSDSLAAVAVLRLAVGLLSTLVNGATTTGVLLWDLGLFIYNLLSKNLPANRVVPEGQPGAGGLWPQYQPPQEGSSRCSCPALNALANHGVLPRDGRNISFQQLNQTVRSSYNFSPTFCYFVANTIATILCKNYWMDSFDLSDIDVHNGIEHDASLTREDSIFQKDQGKPSPKLIERLLTGGTGPNGDLTPADLSRISGYRRTEAKQQNPQFSLSFNHKMFGSSNSSTLLTIFGGRIDDLRPFLLEERIPDGWQSRITHSMGLTIAEFNSTVLKVELGIKEELPASLGFGGVHEDQTKKHA